MSSKIKIYSIAHNETENLYADYTQLLAALPTVAYEPPDKDETNMYFQGTVEIKDFSFIKDLINQINRAITIEKVPNDNNADFVLVILDNDEE